jgi:hypothetical protein
VPWSKPVVSPSRETSKLDQGHDLIEYSLLLTMILLFSVVALESVGYRCGLPDCRQLYGRQHRNAEFVTIYFHDC